MKRLLSIFAILAMVFSIQSCIGNSDNPDYTQSVQLKGYNHIYEPDKTDNPVRNKTAKCVLDVNISQMTMTLASTGAIESDGEEITLTFTDIPMKYSQSKGFSFELPTTTPVSSDGKDYKVSNLKGTFVTYGISDNTTMVAINVLQLSYTVDNKYVITTTMQTPIDTDSKAPQYYFVNSSTTTTAAGLEPFSTTVTSYLVYLTAADKADVRIINAQFAQRMPQMTMVFADVPVKLTAEGYELEAETIVPKINDTPQPNYEVKNFKMNITDNASTATVVFNCNIMDAAYTTRANCLLLPTVKSSTEK